MKPEDCLFCKIVERQLPAVIVYEDDEVLAFKDIHPQAPVHVLVIPKAHLDSVDQVSAGGKNTLEPMILAANRLAREFGVQKGGYRIVINCKQDGGQTVNHLHLHLLGGRKMSWPPG